MDQDTIKRAIKRARLENAIEWHLKYNFYPPYPRALIKPCLEAIEAVNQGNPNGLIIIPTNEGGQGGAKAGDLIEFFNLEGMIETEAIQ